MYDLWFKLNNSYCLMAIFYLTMILTIIWCLSLPDKFLTATKKTWSKIVSFLFAPNQNYGFIRFFYIIKKYVFYIFFDNFFLWTLIWICWHVLNYYQLVTRRRPNIQLGEQKKGIFFFVQKLSKNVFLTKRKYIIWVKLELLIDF